MEFVSFVVMPFMLHLALHVTIGVPVFVISSIFLINFSVSETTHGIH
jgi:hypothetical protein